MQKKKLLKRRLVACHTLQVWQINLHSAQQMSCIDVPLKATIVCLCLIYPWVGKGIALLTLFYDLLCPRNFGKTLLAFGSVIFGRHSDCKATSKNRLLSLWWLKQSSVFRVPSSTSSCPLQSSLNQHKVCTFLYNCNTGRTLFPCPLVFEINSLHSIYCCKFLLSVQWRDQVGGWHCLVWEVFCWLHSNRLLETGVDGVANGNRCCSANNVGQCKHEPRLWAPAFNWTSVCVFLWLTPVQVKSVSNM